MATPNGNRSITLTDEQHGVLLFAQLDQLAQSMSIASENALHAKDLAPANPERAGAISDLRSSLKILREDLDALDALGWPEEGDR